MFKFNLLPNEKVEHIYRQRESVLFKPALVILLLIYLPWFFLIKYDLAGSFLKLLFVWTVVVLAYGINKYLLWLINVYLLTNRRLVLIIYHNLFSKKVLETPLQRILNISFTKKGFWQTLFAYGSVVVQVAGLPEPMVLHNVGHPEQVKDLLWQSHGSHEPKTLPLSKIAAPTAPPALITKVVSPAPNRRKIV